MRRCAGSNLCGYVKCIAQDIKPSGVRPFITTNVVKVYGLQLDLENRDIVIDQNLKNFLKRPRQYASMTTGLPIECWNCAKVINTLREQIICNGCGCVQDVNSKINYFDLMDIPEHYNVEMRNLTKQFHQLQSAVHPDKYCNKSLRDQENSADWSALINKAYTTIFRPVDRGQYLLKLKGVDLSLDNSTLNKEFLLRMMERNEEIEEATTSDELNKLMRHIKTDLEVMFQRVNNAFKNNELDKALNFIVEMKYLISIENRIKDKLQTLMIEET